ncbi:uncharacterized protein IWZ02DRAFT_45066 [Phyllosticta citriasiana]|uniref:uncharacterized protein n=1 Tax=Phyllosticta citriasiana TaxID=595635 RepID=UPI0030FDD62A
MAADARAATATATATATCDLRPATCDLRPATCDLRPATCDAPTGRGKPSLSVLLMFIYFSATSGWPSEGWVRNRPSPARSPPHQVSASALPCPSHRSTYTQLHTVQSVSACNYPKCIPGASFSTVGRAQRGHPYEPVPPCPA